MPLLVSLSIFLGGCFSLILWLLLDDRLFTLHETTSTLSVSSIPPSPQGTAQTFDSVSIVPTNSPAGISWFAAEILIPPTSAKYPTQYIYVSNRSARASLTGTQGDPIAIFQLINQGQPNEKLQLINQVYTGLKQVRGMMFGNTSDGGSDYLVAASAVGDGGVAVFQRTEGGKSLKKVATNKEIPTRTSFVWV